MTTHASPRRMYYLIFATLLGLTALTVAVTFVDLGRASIIIALAIALTKASLVVLFFMHVRESSALTKVVIACGVVTFAILMTLIFSDYLSRAWLKTPEGW